jgi:hypothetical protein
VKSRYVIALLCAVFLIVTGCATTPLGFRADPSGDFIHIHSDMRFPKAVGNFTRVGTHIFDGAGYDIGVGYNLYEPFMVVMTVYVYPSEGKTLVGGFEKVVNDIKEVHPDAVRISDSDIEHSHNGEMAVGKSAIFTYRGEEGQEFVSGAYLFEYGRWYIFYRATYERHRQTEGAKKVQEFMDKLSWPSLL